MLQNGGNLISLVHPGLALTEQNTCQNTVTVRTARKQLLITTKVAKSTMLENL